MRYCCDELKERGGADNQIVATGVRWAESIRRSSRRMIEPCYRKARGRTLFHPIIEWTTDDVWQYIRVRGLRYCPLYDEGFTRLGCVMCPLTDSVEREMNRWPRIAALWKRAILDTYDPDKNGSRRFNSPEEYWDWWLRRGVSPTDGDTLFSNGIDYE
jgi:phosphoadenosine phosphosulfate reductase